MLPKPVRENGCDREAHHRVSRREAAALTQWAVIAPENVSEYFPLIGISVGLSRRAIAFVTIINIVSSTTASPASKLVA
jgi:hypothetical protein